MNIGGLLRALASIVVCLYVHAGPTIGSVAPREKTIAIIGSSVAAGWVTAREAAQDMKNGVYGPPERLPPPVNTDANEAGPFIAPDGSYLLFQSNRPGGFGIMDLYVAYRISAAAIPGKSMKASGRISGASSPSAASTTSCRSSPPVMPTIISAIPQPTGLSST